jgi:LPPG:FO 2-phospho-L-lactate transferase
MSDQPVRARVLTAERWWPLQEFLIKLHGTGEVLDVEFRGLRAAQPTPEVLDAIATAHAIIIGPSNPVISIGPILALDGVKSAVRAAQAPVVAVSPLVDGQVLKGPTDAFMRWAGHPLSSDGIVAGYGDLLDGLVADQPAAGLPVLETSVLMDGPEARRALAARTLDFTVGLR